MKKSGQAIAAMFVLFMLVLFMAGCGSSSDTLDKLVTGESESGSSESGGSSSAAGTREATPRVLVPEALGENVITDKNGLASIDVSNIAEGYFMVNYSGEIESVKVQVAHPSIEMPYTYDLQPSKYGSYEVFPLQLGSGSYTVGVWEQTPDGQYAQLVEEAIEVEIADELKPFLYPSQIINFTEASKVVAKASQLAGSANTELDVVDSIFSFIIENITYDEEKALAVQDGTIPPGYLPNVDSTLEELKGICYDYAALMAAMLRSQGIPVKLVKGYVQLPDSGGQVYHAWVMVYSKETGEINRVIKFEGNNWTLMDPTFSATAGGAADFVGDGTNYDDLFVY